MTTLTFDSDRWRELLEKGSRDCGVAISKDQIKQFHRHAEELLRWNRKTNLTAITDSGDLAIKHFLDAVIPTRFIPANSKNLLDIGTGAGFPGLPLKVMNPSLACTLIDASRKKISFVSHIARNIGLTGVETIHIRAEDLALKDNYRHCFDVIVSRALSSLASVVRISLPLLSNRGRIIAYRGRQDVGNDENLRSLLAQGTGLQKVDFSIETYRYVLPVVHAKRVVVLISANRV